jgi:hypothetical protein
MGRNLLRPLALLGTVAMMLSVMVLLTFSHATFSMSGVGGLKCHTTGGIQKAC